MIKKVYAIVLCIIFVFSCNAYADQKSDLESKNQQTQSEINEIKERIKKAEESKSPYLEKKKELDTKLNEANAELSRLTNQVNSIQSDINAKQADIDWLDGEESKSREIFKERMRALYEDNKMSYIDILFDSGSISDFFNRLEIIKQLADYDNEIIESIVFSKEKIAEAKAVLDEQKSRVEVVRTEAQAARDKVNALEIENQQVLDAINSDISAAKAEQAAKEKEAANIQNQIKKLLEQQNNSGTTLTYSSKGMVWPCPGYKTLTSQFGRRFHPVLKIYRSHNGIDIAANSGANVIAAADGVVITSQYSSSYGNYIVINHGSGVTTLYAHMSSRGVSVGANVKAGQSIGKVGSTGISTGPHLHFEVSVNGTRQDPESYVK